jgi:uncharacterized protein YebE (UPF0316 family)
MVIANMFQFDVWTWIIIPLLIFCARIIDVSMGTIRVIFISKGLKKVASILGFFEIIVWLLAISGIMKNLDNWISYVAYGAGFATGTYMGMLIEEKLSIGKVILRIITKKDSHKLVRKIRSRWHATILDGETTKDAKVKLIFMVLKKKEAKEVISLVNKYQPKAFYTIEDVRYAIDRGLPLSKTHKFSHFHFLKRK